VCARAGDAHAGEFAYRERRARFMAMQSTISAGRLARRVGTKMTVLVDAVEGRGRDAIAIARSAADAPEIDGVVRVSDGGDLAVGGFASVRVTGSDEHDLTTAKAT